MADSLVQFRTLQHDRDDIIKGEFRMWPRRGIAVVIPVTLADISISRYTVKDLQKDTLVISSTCKFEATAEASSSMSIVRAKETLSLPAEYTFRFTGNIPCEQQEELLALAQGNEVMIEGRVLEVRTQRIMLPDPDKPITRPGVGLEEIVYILVDKIESVQFLQPRS